MKTPKSIARLIDQFERLPGVGPKTAQRMVFYLLHFPQEEIERFADALIKFKVDTKICDICKNVDETNPCGICEDSTRDRNTIAVVSSPLDAFALERAGYKGLYHVLHGVIDPLNNIGPEEIFISELVQRLDSIDQYAGSASSDNEVEDAFESFMKDDFNEFENSKKVSDSSSALELILATNTSMEGESTAMYITKLIREKSFDAKRIKISRIARGLPVGGDIEYADDVTILKSLEGRSSV